MSPDSGSPDGRPVAEAPQLSLAEYRLLVENSADVVFQAVGGVLRWISPAVTALCGWRPEEVIGRSTLEFFDPDDHEAVAVLRRRAYAGEPGRGVFRLRRKDGTLLWVEVVLRPYTSDDGAAGTVGAFHDVAERVAAEQALAASEERFRLLAENVTDVLWQLDLRSGLYTYISPSVEGLTGHTQAEALALPIEQLLSPESAQLTRTLLAEAMSAFVNGDAGTVATAELEMSHKDGGFVPIEISARFLPSPDGVPRQVIGVSRGIAERRAARRALQESEARFRAVTASAADAIVTADVYGTITGWNPAAERLFGYTEEEAVGESVTIVMPESFWGMHPGAMQRFRERGERHIMGTVVTLQARRRDRSEFPVELSLAEWEVAGGRFVTAIIRDVSDRRLAERALLESEARYRALYEESPIAVELYDAAGRLVGVNPACLELFGVDDAVRLQGFDLFADPNLEDEHKDRLRRGEIVRYQGPFDFEAVKRLDLYRTSRSGLSWLDVLITPILSTAVGYLVQVQEVTAQRDAEAELREMHDRLDFAQRAAGAGTWDWDVPNDIVTWSPQLYDLFGLDCGAAPASLDVWDAVVHPEDLEASHAAHAGALADHAALHHEYRIVRPDGEIRWISSLGHGAYDEEGRPLRMVGLCIDTTERRGAEDEIRRLNAELEQRVKERTRELQASNEELEAFAYSISHDLRAPLRAIDGFSQILMEDNLRELDVAGRDNLTRVRAAAQKMDLLIDALLALSRLSRRELSLDTVDLSRLAAAHLQRLRELEPERVVSADITEGCTAVADAALIDVVLANLLGNAWKFTSGREEAHVELGETSVGGERVFFVRDDGVGFDQAYVGKLFEPFHRLHREDEFPGTGIGLATVRRILVRLGGRCWAEGVAGQGATFFFTLPRAGREERRATAEA
jgi:PAS domain S-box-containing protein